MNRPAGQVPLSFGAVAAILLCLPACQDPQSEAIRTLQQDLSATRLEAQESARIADKERRRSAELQAQVDGLTRFGSGQIEKMFTVDRIELASLTGAADFDGVPGDDGVVVYIRPLDRDGHVLKAAGEITVEIIDAGQPGSPRSLGVCTVGEPDELRKIWYGGLMTNHFTIKCPWGAAQGPPSAAEVEIKVTFYDYLTGKRFSASQTVKVTPPAEAEPAPAEANQESGRE